MVGLLDLAAIYGRDAWLYLALSWALLKSVSVVPFVDQQTIHICGAACTGPHGGVAGPCGYLWTGCMALPSAASAPPKTSWRRILCLPAEVNSHLWRRLYRPTWWGCWTLRLPMDRMHGSTLRCLRPSRNQWASYLLSASRGNSHLVDLLVVHRRQRCH
jgi:hypothetical protein